MAPSLELGSCLQTLPRKEGGWGPVVLSRRARGSREAQPCILQPGPGGAEPRPLVSRCSSLTLAAQTGPILLLGSARATEDTRLAPAVPCSIASGWAGPWLHRRRRPGSPRSHHLHAASLWQVPAPRPHSPSRQDQPGLQVDGSLEKRGEPSKAGASRGRSPPLWAPQAGRLGLALSGELSTPAEGRLRSPGPCLGQPGLLDAP